MEEALLILHFYFLIFFSYNYKYLEVYKKRT